MGLFDRQKTLIRFTAFFLSVYFTLFSSFSYTYAKDLGTLTVDGNTIPVNFHIPGELGSVSGSYFPSINGPKVSQKSARPALIVYIQDAHGQTSAQSNISKILAYLVKHYGFKTVFLEGGLDGPISPDLLRFFNDESLNEKTASQLLDEGKIGGPEVFLLQSGRNVQAYGIETAGLYRENLESFRKVLGSKKNSDAFLRGLKDKLLVLGSHYFGPDMAKFVREWLRFQDSRAEAISHLNVLEDYARKTLKIDFTKATHQFEYPQLARYFSMKQSQGKVIGGDFRSKIDRDMKRLGKWLAKNGFDPAYAGIFEALSKCSLSPMESSYPVDVRSFLEHFYETAKPKGFSFSDYYTLMKYLGLLLLAQEMEAETFFAEIKKLNVELVKQLAKTPEENSLARLMNDYLLSRKFYALELMREEYAEVIEKSKIISPAMLNARLRMLQNRKVRIDVNDSLEMAELFNEALRFYDFAAQREDTMFRNMMSALDKSPASKVILVTGGFHARGLESLMRDQGLAFLEITPKMSGVESKEKYLKRMMLGSSTIPPLSLGKIALPELEKRFERRIALALRADLESSISKIARPDGPAAKIHRFETAQEASSLGREAVPFAEAERKVFTLVPGKGFRSFQRFVSKLIPEPIKEFLRKFMFRSLKNKLEKLLLNNPLPENIKRDDQKSLAALAEKKIRRWIRRHQIRIHWLFPFVLSYPRDPLEYQRNNVEVNRKFGIFSHVWRPNGGSTRIHGHDGVLAITFPLTEGMNEESYELAEPPGENFIENTVVTLNKTGTSKPKPGELQNITKGRGSIHRIWNQSDQPGMMIEFYFWNKTGPLTFVNNFIPVEGDEKKFWVRRDPIQDLAKPVEHILWDAFLLSYVGREHFKARLSFAAVDPPEAKRILPIYTSSGTVITDIKKAIEFLDQNKPHIHEVPDRDRKVIVFDSRVFEDVPTEDIVGASLGKAADSNIVRPIIFQHINGLMAIPTLYAFAEKGVFRELFGNRDDAGAKQAGIMEIAERFNSDDPAQNLGHLWGAMNVLALQGWLKRTGKDESAKFTLTEQGREAVRLAESPAFSNTFKAIPHFKNYHVYFRGPPDEHSKAALQEFKELVALSRQEWNLPRPHDRISARVINQLKKALDGMMMAPVMIALGMPEYEQRESGIAEKKGTEIFNLFDPGNHGLDLNELPSSLNRGFVESSFDFLESQGIVRREGPKKHLVFLTELGLGFVEKKGEAGEDEAEARNLVSSYGVTASYLKGYQYLEDLLFGNPDPFDVEHEGHIDRVMDVWGSSGSHRPYLRNGKGEGIFALIKNEFDKPLEEQPAGIADIGCGDGKMIMKVVKFIIADTERGRYLKERPLVVVAADYNPASRARASATLEVFKNVPGIAVEVLKGDVTRPDLYDKDISDRMADRVIRGEQGLSVKDSDTGMPRLVGAKDLIHTQMFLPHERHLQVRNRTEALQIIRESLKKIDRKDLAEAVKANGDTRPLPEDEEELLKRIIEQFTTSFSDKGRLVPAVVAAADLIQFIDRWTEFAQKGLIILDLHSPHPDEMYEFVPQDPNEPLLVEQLAAAAYWGTHYMSRQQIMRFTEHNLCFVLAGQKAVETVRYPSPSRKNGKPRPTTISLSKYIPAQVSESFASSLGKEREGPIRLRDARYYGEHQPGRFPSKSESRPKGISHQSIDEIRIELAVLTARTDFLVHLIEEKKSLSKKAYLEVLDEAEMLDQEIDFLSPELISQKLIHLAERVKTLNMSLEADSNYVRMKNGILRSLAKIRESGKWDLLENYYAQTFSQRAKENRMRGRRLREIRSELGITFSSRAEPFRKYAEALDPENPPSKIQIEGWEKGFKNVSPDVLRRAEEYLLISKEKKSKGGPESPPAAASSLGSIPLDSESDVLVVLGHLRIVLSLYLRMSRLEQGDYAEAEKIASDFEGDWFRLDEIEGLLKRIKEILPKVSGRPNLILPNVEAVAQNYFKLMRDLNHQEKLNDFYERVITDSTEKLRERAIYQQALIQRIQGLSEASHEVLAGKMSSKLNRPVSEAYVSDLSVGQKTATLREITALQEIFEEIREKIKSLGDLTKTPVRYLDGQAADLLQMMAEGKFNPDVLDRIKTRAFARVIIDSDQPYLTVTEYADASKHSEDQPVTAEFASKMARSGVFPGAKQKNDSDDSWLIPSSEARSFLNSVSIRTVSEALGIYPVTLYVRLQNKKRARDWNIRRWRVQANLIPVEEAQRRVDQQARLVRLNLVYFYLSKAGIGLSMDILRRIVKNPSPYFKDAAGNNPGWLKGRKSLITKDVIGREKSTYTLDLLDVWHLFNAFRELKREAKLGIDTREITARTGLSREEVSLVMHTGVIKAKQQLLFMGKKIKYLVQPEQVQILEQMMQNPGKKERIKKIISEARRRTKVEKDASKLKALATRKGLVRDLNHLIRTANYYLSLIGENLREKAKSRAPMRRGVIPFTELLARVKFHAQTVPGLGIPLNLIYSSKFEQLKALIANDVFQEQEERLDRYYYRNFDPQRYQQILRGDELKSLRGRSGMVLRKYAELAAKQVQAKIKISAESLSAMERGIIPVPDEVMVFAKRQAAVFMDPEGILNMKSPDILGASLGVQSELTAPVFNGVVSDASVIAVARETAGGIFRLRSDAGKAHLLELMKREEEAALKANAPSAAVSKFNSDFNIFIRYLGLDSGKKLPPAAKKDNPFVLVTHPEVLSGKIEIDPNQGPGKLVRGFQTGDLIIGIWKGSKPVIINRLKQAAQKQMIIEDIPEGLVSDHFLRSILVQHDIPRDVIPVSVGALSESGDLTLSIQGISKIKLNMDVLAQKGIDPIQILVLIRQIASNPASRARLFYEAGFGFNEKLRYWEVGEGFVDRLEQIYAESLGRKAVEQAA